ncbi:MAG: sialate O-acetylesterase [Pseudomonadota bacterium]
MFNKNNTLEKLLFSILFLIVANNVVAAPDPNFHIYLMFGQSNMEGAAPIENQDRITNQRVRVMADLNCGNLGRTYGNWYVASPPLNRCNSGLGPGDYFGKTMAEGMPSAVTIGLVPAAVSGTPIELYQKSAPIGRNNQNIPTQFNGGYAWLLDMAKKAQQAGVIKGIIFHQGESDTSDPNWKNQVKEIVTDLRKDLGIGDVPFLAGELLYANYGSCCHWHNSEVNKLPGLINNAYVVSAMGLPGMDVYHFTTASYREFGRRYAQIMLDKIDRYGVSPSSSISSSSSSRSSSTNNSLPFTTQAENYSTMNGIQTETTADTGGGLNVGWTDANDSLSYSDTGINIPATGSYKITYRVASLNGGGSFTLREVGGSNYDNVSVPGTGGWQTWVDVSRTITLTAGVHKFGLLVNTGGFNINWFKIEAAGNSSSTPPISSSSSSRSSTAGSASCKQIVSNDWGSGFSAMIRITNNRTTAINGWNIGWTYSDGTRISGSYNATVTGSNPYSASNLSWNSTIQPGQYVEFGFQATKGGSTVNVPTFTGAACN